jgi:hypothetical protein
MASSLRAIQGNGPAKTEIQRRHGGNRFHDYRSMGQHKDGGQLIGKVYTILSALLLACMAALERYPTIQTLHLRGVALKRSVSSC